MKNSTYPYTLAVLSYVGCQFIHFELLFLCGSIFSAAYFITYTLEEKVKKE